MRVLPLLSPLPSRLKISRHQFLRVGQLLDQWPILLHEKHLSPDGDLDGVALPCLGRGQSIDRCPVCLQLKHLSLEGVEGVMALPLLGLGQLLDQWPGWLQL